MEQEYLHSIRKQFEYYKSAGEKTFNQLNEQDFFRQFNEESNSIAIIVNHLSENMKSRWTDFLTWTEKKNGEIVIWNLKTSLNQRMNF
jgi:hypothetical protein